MNGMQAYHDRGQQGGPCPGFHRMPDGMIVVSVGVRRSLGIGPYPVSGAVGPMAIGVR